MILAKLFRRVGGHGGAQGVVPDPRYFNYQEEDAFNICPPEEIYIKSIPLIMLSDIQRVMTELKAGNIVILHIKPMLQRDKTRNELKRAVDQLRGICRQLDGDIAQLGGEYIIITPGPFVKIYKPEQKKAEEKPEEAKKPEEAREEAIRESPAEFSQPELIASKRMVSPVTAKIGSW